VRNYATTLLRFFIACIIITSVLRVNGMGKNVPIHPKMQFRRISTLTPFIPNLGTRMKISGGFTIKKQRILSIELEEWWAPQPVWML
jgi:hypothetical protein